MMPDVCGPDAFLKGVSNQLIRKPCEPKLLREIVAGALAAA